MRDLLRVALVCAGLVGAACAGGGGDFTISGRVAASAAGKPAAAGARTVTHVMAVNPETAAPRRTVAAVGEGGSFRLAVDAGKPYVIVFVDSSAVGPAMVVGIFRALTLDTVAPQLAGHLDLGDVEVDPARQTATATIAYDALLQSLGLSAGDAETLGAIDDLSLRYANPDLDGDGVIDAEQGREIALDFHVRADLRRGSSAGPSFTVADITDRFLPEAGADVAVPVFNLASIYVEYPQGFDATQYVAAGAPAGGLTNGARYVATLADGSTPQAPSSYSALGYGDVRGWGPDYDLERVPGLELPGSGGVPATLAYTLGASGKTLTFTNVVTRTRASLTAAGSLAIFIRLVTAGGRIATIDYVWMKRTAAASWTPATAEEIALTIGSDGGYVSVHRLPSWANELGVAIPAQPAGSVAWSHEATGPDDICGLAVSFDDKLGLRHFVGGVAPNPGVTCTP
jgi:hypothetical protein